MIKLDERGHQCPLPVINTKKVLETAAKGETILVLTDNEIAVQNLNKLAVQKGCGFSFVKKANDLFESTITVNEGPAAAETRTEEPVYCDCTPVKTAVAVSSSAMGNGDDDLGKLLMKSFIFALTQTSPLPADIVFYNGGAFLTCEGSPALEDLKSLSEAGVKIHTCGTCLNHYNLNDQLVIGDVSNMYEIVEILNGTSKVIRP